MSESATWLLSSTDGEVNGGWTGVPVTPDRHLYECSDGGWIAVAASEPRTWHALCDALGMQDLEDSLHRWEDPDTVTQRLASAFRTRTAAEWVAELGAKGAAVVRANRGAELKDDPQLLARGTLQEVGDVLVPRNPIRIRDADRERSPIVSSPPPAPGADTRAVLAQAGFSPDEISELRVSGVVAGE
jgi:alpha-methylacyl-CoA racemase